MWSISFHRRMQFFVRWKLFRRKISWIMMTSVFYKFLFFVQSFAIPLHMMANGTTHVHFFITHFVWVRKSYSLHATQAYFCSLINLPKMREKEEGKTSNELNMSNLFIAWKNSICFVISMQMLMLNIGFGWYVIIIVNHNNLKFNECRF